MANTYTQLYIQIVFAVKYRRCLIDYEWKEELHKYISGIIQRYNHKVIAINGMSDHIHIFIGMKPAQSLSQLVQFIKEDSCKWINEQKLVHSKFQWQLGYGAFSYSQSHIATVATYIENQEHHHKEKSMRKEYREFLQKFEIDYNDAYIFHDPI